MTLETIFRQNTRRHAIRTTPLCVLFAESREPMNEIYLDLQGRRRRRFRRSGSHAVFESRGQRDTGDPEAHPVASVVAENSGSQQKSDKSHRFG